MVQLVSYRSSLCRSKRIQTTINILNNATEPFVLFAGNTLLERDDIFTLESQLTNKHVAAIFEVRHVKNSNYLDETNCLYYVCNGKVNNMFSHQLFATSDEIRHHKDLAERLLLELEQRRTIEVEGRKCIVFQCGEINILSNIQSEHNRVVFRFPNNEALYKRFLNLLEESDVVLNPMHTPMGNQYKMQKRREYLSANNRFYFSCSNTRPQNIQKHLKEGSLQNKLQYAYKNGSPLIRFDAEMTNDYLIQYF